jgi:16S rRNA (cytosine967-C5)-methyltransferase
MGSIPENPRQLAFLILEEIDRHQTYTDIALDRILQKSVLDTRDRSLVSELVYGVIRRERSLDALIDLLAKKKAIQQPPKLRRIFHLGLYQLRYLSQIPASAAVNTTVDLAKINGLSRLTGVVNGLLRNYLRQTAKDELLLPPQIVNSQKEIDLSPLESFALTSEVISQMGIFYSFPDWIVEKWLQQLSFQETSKLLDWFNQPAKIDLRVNILQTSVAEVKTALENAGVQVSLIPHVPQGLRIESNTGNIKKLPGYDQGWWMVQDASAQLVTHLLDPQPGEMIIDACAAPGGKTTHIAELMGDKGEIWASDRSAARLKKVAQNAYRLKLNSINALAEDSRNLKHFVNKCDRVLLDAPCSGLGTLNKRPDIRWRQTPEKIAELTTLQQELLEKTAILVKPGGILVYATCTLNHQENEKVIQSFLENHPHWSIEKPSGVFQDTFDTTTGWLKIYPHQHNMDGFFMVKLIRE